MFCYYVLSWPTTHDHRITRVAIISVNRHSIVVVHVSYRECRVLGIFSYTIVIHQINSEHQIRICSQTVKIIIP